MSQNLIFEFYTIGRYTKVSVMDPETTLEAVIVLPSELDIAVKRILAIKKLDFLRKTQK